MCDVHIHTQSNNQWLAYSLSLSLYSQTHAYTYFLTSVSLPFPLSPILSLPSFIIYVTLPILSVNKSFKTLSLNLNPFPHALQYFGRFFKLPVLMLPEFHHDVLGLLLILTLLSYTVVLTFHSYSHLYFIV